MAPSDAVEGGPRGDFAPAVGVETAPREGVDFMAPTEHEKLAEKLRAEEKKLEQMREELEQMRDEAAAKFSETMDQAMNQLITSVIHAMTAMRAATVAAQRPDP